MARKNVKRVKNVKTLSRGSRRILIGVRFEAVLETEDEGVFIRVPPEIVAELGQGRKRPPVLVTLNGYTFPSTIAVYGGGFFVPVRREVRKAAAVEPGRTLAVELVVDESRRR